MNQQLKDIMLAHGLHKHISEDCEHRMEMLYDLVVRECAYTVQDYVNHRRPASEYPELLKHHFGVE